MPYENGDPKRDHDFDNHPFALYTSRIRLTHKSEVSQGLGGPGGTLEGRNSLYTKIGFTSYTSRFTSDANIVFKVKPTCV